MNTHIETEEKRVVRKFGEFPIKIRDGSQTVTVYRAKSNFDWLTYTVNWWLQGKRVRRSYSSPARAVQEAQRVLKSLKAGRREAAEIPPEKMLYLLECERKLEGRVPLHEAVSFYLAQHPLASGSAMTLRDAVDSYLAVCHERNLSPRHLETLHFHLKYFKEMFGERPLAGISKVDLDQFLDSRGWADRTRSNWLVSAHSFFRWATKEGLLPHDRPTAVDLVTAPQVKRKTPGIFTPDDLRVLLSMIPEPKVPYFVISAFGASRRAEVQRLRFEDIDFEERVIRFEVEITKTNSRRIVDISEVLFDWLAPFQGATGPICADPDPLYCIRDEWKKAGRSWPHNALRHSFCSYHLAKYRNAALTAELAGNSVKELNKSYKSLVTRKDADAWFSCTRSVVFPR